MFYSIDALKSSFTKFCLNLMKVTRPAGFQYIQQFLAWISPMHDAYANYDVKTIVTLALQQFLEPGRKLLPLIVDPNYKDALAQILNGLGSKCEVKSTTMEELNEYLIEVYTIIENLH